MSVQRKQPPFRHQRGQALAEFSIVILVALVIVLGLFDVGRAVFMQNSISDAARNGVREAIVDQDCAAIATSAQSAASGVDLTASNAIQVTIYKAPMPTSVPAPDTCTGGLGGGYGIGYLAEVKVTTTYRPITPLIGQILGPMTLSSTARLPIERAYP